MVLDWAKAYIKRDGIPPVHASGIRLHHHEENGREHPSDIRAASFISGGSAFMLVRVPLVNDENAYNFGNRYFLLNPHELNPSAKDFRFYELDTVRGIIRDKVNREHDMMNRMRLSWKNATNPVTREMASHHIDQSRAAINKYCGIGIVLDEAKKILTEADKPEKNKRALATASSAPT